MACKTDNITQEYLKSILNYVPETGVFIWKRRPVHHFEDGKYPKERICATWNGKNFGKIAGSLNSDKYNQIKIDNVLHKAHRLAHLYVYGWMPDEVDHKNVNGLRSDNRINNLRGATRINNQHNRTKYKNNTSGYKGVSYHKKQNKWNACIQVNKIKIHLGSFNTPKEAHEAYKEAALRLHGEYARY